MTAWLALFALALNFAWPVVAMASPRGQDGLTDLCTATVAQLADGRTSHSKGPGLAPSHCSFCQLASGKAVVSSPTALPPVALEPFAIPADPLIGIPRLSPRTLIAAPRAPPFSS
jgi:hypothetical protein